MPFMKDFIQLNKFSKLHDGHRIIFCKTDYLLQEFAYIAELKDPVVLITGNSDYSIDRKLFNYAPINKIKIWYAQNAAINESIIEPIPMGIENRYPSVRDGHGIGYHDRVEIKEYVLNNIDTSITPTRFIYSNFNVATNYHYRSVIKTIALQASHIDHENPTLDIPALFNRFLDYRMVLCPIGNGFDTHRLWEVLYCDRVPIIIKHSNLKIYKLYDMFPIIVLKNESELLDKSLIQNLYDIAITKKFDKNMLYTEYWANKIMRSI